MVTLHAQFASGGGNRVKAIRDSNIDLTEGSQRGSCRKGQDKDLFAQQNSGHHRPCEATPEASSWEIRVRCKLVELLQVMLR